MQEKKEKFVRLNTRATKEQHKFFKAEAKRLKIKEGEAHRIAFDFYINNHKK